MPPDVEPPTKLIARTREQRFAGYRLVVLEGPDQARAASGAEHELSVGTAEANELRLTDDAVSRHHFVVAPTERGHLLRDLGSTNGTSINGVLVERAYLSPGAIIKLGATRLQFETLGTGTSAALSAEIKWGRALGTSDAMRRIFAMLPRLAASDATLLLEGETGTGKSMLAAALHEASPRASGPFVVIDCGAIPPSLIESELFGHEKGSFTGATSSRAGAFEAARGGTLFLDEIGELPLDMQPKLLRALEERVVKRIGGNASIQLDIRIIAATNRDLRSEINRGRFRSDVYYRLNTFRLRVPPLRERRDDIPLLVAHFYEQFAPAGEQPPSELLIDFARHDWPGNVRELRAAIERAVLLDDPTVWRDIFDEPAPSPPPVAEVAPPSGAALETGAPPASFRAAKERAVAEWEREYVRALIERHSGNLSRAAREVRMDRNHLRELMVRHRVRAEES